MAGVIPEKYFLWLYNRGPNPQFKLPAIRYPLYAVLKSAIANRKSQIPFPRVKLIIESRLRRFRD
jgi:hypothetical protein